MTPAIPNPLPEPVKKNHAAISFDIEDVEDERITDQLARDPWLYIDESDDFDFHIPDDDDFDI